MILQLLTKSDLLTVLDDFDPDVAHKCLQQLANPAPMFELSAKSGAGMQSWLGWVDKVLA